MSTFLCTIRSFFIPSHQQKTNYLQNLHILRGLSTNSRDTNIFILMRKLLSETLSGGRSAQTQQCILIVEISVIKELKGCLAGKILINLRHFVFMAIDYTTEAFVL